MESSKFIESYFYMALLSLYNQTKERKILMAIRLEDLTNGTTVVNEVDGIKVFTWEGTAVFDILVHILNENLKIQFDSGRILATDYANVYIQGLQTCITESMKFIMQKDNLIKDEDLKQANIDLLNRQKEGFDDNKHQKLFEAQMNAWALMFSSGLLTTKPEIISNDSASSLYNTLKPK